MPYRMMGSLHARLLSLRREDGQGTVEYVGIMLLLATALTGAVVAAPAARRTSTSPRRSSTRSSRPSTVVVASSSRDAAEAPGPSDDWPRALRPRSPHRARSASSTPASAASPSCTSCSWRCRRRTSCTSATPRASRTATARRGAASLLARRSPTRCSRAARSCSSSRATRRRRRRCPRCGGACGRRRSASTSSASSRPEASAGRGADANGRIGLLATPTTVASGAYARGARERRPARAPDAPSPCPELAPIIQDGAPFDEGDVETVRGYCAPAARGGRRHGDPRLHALPARRARCSSACSGPSVTLVTSGTALARHVEHALAARDLAHAARAERGRLPLPMHRRRRGVPRARHALPAAAAGRGRAHRPVATSEVPA